MLQKIDEVNDENDVSERLSGYKQISRYRRPLNFRSDSLMILTLSSDMQQRM